MVADEIRFDDAGLVPAVVQDAATGAVLMLGFMNRSAIEATLETGHVTFWSRSRQKFWVKGESSGHYLLLRALFVNCEMNSLLIKAEPIGPTCHEGYATCYFRQISADGEHLDVIAERLKSPDEIYGAAR